MALLDSRFRAGYLFLAIVVAHLVLISAQVTSRTGVPLLEAFTFGVFAEVQRAVSSVAGGVRGIWDAYIGLRHVRTENEALHRRLAELQIELQEERSLAGRTRSLEQLLGLRDRMNLHTVAAEIIASGATPDFRTVTIDKGTGHGIAADMAVLAPAGVVGRVVSAGRRASKVQLLVDRNAAAGALIDRSRAQGVVVGSAAERLRLEYVSEVADVAIGDLVVTSGIDGIYPKGFTIGEVESIEKSGGAYRQILVRPAVDFSALEEVLVVLVQSPAQDGEPEQSP